MFFNLYKSNEISFEMQIPEDTLVFKMAEAS